MRSHQENISLALILRQGTIRLRPHLTTINKPLKQGVQIQSSTAGVQPVFLSYQADEAFSSVSVMVGQKSRLDYHP